MKLVLPAVPSVVLADSINITSRSAFFGGLVITAQTSTVPSDSITV